MRNVAEKYTKNVLKQILPFPFSAIIETIDDCKSDEMLKNKFDDLKKYVKDLQSTLPNSPIGIEVEYANVVVIYYLDALINEEHEVFEEEINLKFEELGLLWPEIQVYSDCIILQCTEEVCSKDEWKEEVIPVVKQVLESFDNDIRALLFV